MSKSLATIARHPLRAAVIVALALVALAATVVFAVPLPPASDTVNDPQFEFDANLLTENGTGDGVLDWDEDANASHFPVIEATRLGDGHCNQTNVPATAGGPGSVGAGLLICDGSKGSFTDADHFTQGSKNESTAWEIVGGSNPKKGDLSELMLYAKFGDSSFDADGLADDLFIFSGATRLDVDGSTHMDIELNQQDVKRNCTVSNGDISCPNGPERSEGDILIAVDLPRGGIPEQRLFLFCGEGTAPLPDCPVDVTFGPAGEVCANSPQVEAPCFVEVTAPPTAAQAVFNSDAANPRGDPAFEIDAPSWRAVGCERTTSDPSPGCRLRDEIPEAGFMETYTDLTAFGISVECPGFSNVVFKTRSSDELNSALKDDSEGVINIQQCSMAWEKRDGSVSAPHPPQGGATFTVGGASGPFACLGDTTNPVDVVDNSTNDSDGDAGQLLLDNICFGTYTVTETDAPSGFIKDSDTDRVVIVGASELNPVIGAQGTDDHSDGDSTGSDCSDSALDPTGDECDFHNRLGSIEWEKRDESQALHPLQGGATFTVGGASGPFACHGDATNPVTVVDNFAPDVDADNGQFRLERVCLGTYTITETVAPSGFLIDDDPTRVVTVSEGSPDVGVGTLPLGPPPGTDDDGTELTDDFHNRAGSLIIRKEAKNADSGPGLHLLGGAKFRITPNPLTGADFLDVTDNAGLDQYTTPGLICLDAVRLLSYNIEELESFTTYEEDPDVEPFTVNTSSTCAGRAAIPESDTLGDVTFENKPLSEIEIIFTSLAGTGVTQLGDHITCTGPGGVVDDDDADTAGPPPFNHAVLDRDETFTDLVEGTYNCTIVIDP